MIWDTEEKKAAAKACYWYLRFADVNLEKAKLAVIKFMGDKDADALVKYILKLEERTSIAKDFCKGVLGEGEVNLEVTRLRIRVKDTGV